MNANFKFPPNVTNGQSNQENGALPRTNGGNSFPHAKVQNFAIN
jgi:hypothetical protein